VYVTERGRQGAARNLIRSMTEIRQEKYDLVINLSPVGAIILFMAGVYRKPLRVEMPRLWWLLGGHSQTYRLRHAVDQYLHAIAPILDGQLSPEDRQPRLYLTARDRTAARKILRERGLSPANMLVTMHVGGEGFNGRKRWAPERFTAVARHLAERFNAHILLIGGKDDVELAEDVHAQVPNNSTMLAGRTTLKESGALIEMSALFIGNDSCPLHMSAAVGTPAVGIFGPSNYKQFHPVGKANYRQRVVHSNLPCSPCFNFIGNDAPWVPNTCYSHACLNTIGPDDVIKAAMELLQDPRDG
jgi:ADP-heptose:LPS heptosyltransferase